MRKAYRIIIVLGLCLFLFSVDMCIIGAFTFKTGAILTFLGLVLALLVTGIIGFTRWRKSSRFWMFPTLLCLTFIPSPFLGVRVGNFIADQLFKSHLNEYTQVVDDIRSGVIPCGEKFSTIDVKKPPVHVGNIIAVRCNGGKAVLVEFIFDTSSVFFHEGYVYKGYAETDTCIAKDIRPEQRWHYPRHIVGSWYHFSSSN